MQLGSFQFDIAPITPMPINDDEFVVSALFFLLHALLHSAAVRLSRVQLTEAMRHNRGGDPLYYIKYNRVNHEIRAVDR